MDGIYHPEASELLILKLSYSVARRLVQNYIIPLVKYVQQTLSSNAPHSNFVENKNAIAAHVKQVFNNVEVFLSTNADACNGIIEHFKLGKTHFVGLDCEWVSSKKNGVALIQISTGNYCLLHQVAFDSEIPEKLRQILENHSILKFGVAIQEDVKRLQFHGVHTRGFVDLRNLAQRCLPRLQGNLTLTDEADMDRWTSLHKLSFHLLNITLDKNYHTRCSNWETPMLNPSQIEYAAKDAIVSLEIFYVLILLRKVNRQSRSVLVDSFKKLKPGELDLTALCFEPLCGNYNHVADGLVSLTKQKVELYTPSDWLITFAHSLCQGIIDSSHKTKQGNLQNRPSTSKPKRSQKKPCKMSECRDKPLYENCFLIGPDDRILATLNRAKASWYIHNNLGEVISEEPFSVKLFFEPSRKPVSDAEYYTTVKDNLCVVCGATENFVRKIVVPHDYRRYFPLELKYHMSHDVLLMCLDCHRLAQHWDEQLRQKLATEYNAPLGVDDQQFIKARSAAKALYHKRAKIPEERQKELLSVIQTYSGIEDVEDITDEKIREIAGVDNKGKNNRHSGLHGKLVVDAFVADNRLDEFLKMWRQHFLDNMKPKHLPPMWSVEHNLDDLRSKQASRD